MYAGVILAICRTNCSPGRPRENDDRDDRHACILALAVFAVFPVLAQQPAANLPADDLTPDFKAPEPEKDYIKRVEMIPMRDGVKLYTVIVIPKGAKDAPIVLTRTPYNAAARAARSDSAAHD